MFLLQQGGHNFALSHPEQLYAFFLRARVLLGDFVKLRQDSLTLVNLALHVFSTQKLSTISRRRNSIIWPKVSELQERMPQSHALLSSLGNGAQTVPPEVRRNNEVFGGGFPPHNVNQVT